MSEPSLLLLMFKEPFEVRIFPKRHLPYFENTLDADLDYVVDVAGNA